MTIMTLSKKLSSQGAWTVAEAKAKFSEVVERAKRDGPQTITKNGRLTAVVVSVDEWERKAHRTGSLATFFAESPLRESGVVLERVKDEPQPPEL
jgi:prevent-host-death family protein